MVDRFLLWLGAGAVCTGVAVGMLAGAGVANAHTESAGDGGANTSQSAKPAENKPDSDQSDSGKKQRHGQTFGGVKAEDDATVKAGADTDADDATIGAARKSSGSEAGSRTAKLISNVANTTKQAPDRKVVVEKARRTDPAPTVDPAVTTDPVKPVEAVEAKAAVVADDPATPVRPLAVVQRIVSAVTGAAAPTQTTVALAAPAPPLPSPPPPRRSMCRPPSARSAPRSSA